MATAKHPIALCVCGVRSTRFRAISIQKYNTLLKFIYSTKHRVIYDLCKSLFYHEECFSCIASDLEKLINGINTSFYNSSPLAFGRVFERTSLISMSKTFQRYHCRQNLELALWDILQLAVLQHVYYRYRIWFAQYLSSIKYKILQFHYCLSAVNDCWKCISDCRVNFYFFHLTWSL